MTLQELIDKLEEAKSIHGSEAIVSFDWGTDYERIEKDMVRYHEVDDTLMLTFS